MNAVIYEAHVRDFTSDPAIAKTWPNHLVPLKPYRRKTGTISKTGGDHIQLLRVLSYYFVNEFNHEHLKCLRFKQQQLQLGIWPQSYFSLTGMYSSNPKDPEKRIAEFQKSHQLEIPGSRLLSWTWSTTKVDILKIVNPTLSLYGCRRNSSYQGGRLGLPTTCPKRVVGLHRSIWLKPTK